MKAPKKHQLLRLMPGLKLEEEQQLEQFCHCKIGGDKASPRRLEYSDY
jgi:hypothetical protein